jgi:hypothetical protein
MQGFWPCTCQDVEVTKTLDDRIVYEEFSEDEYYIGLLSQKPLPSFRIGCDTHMISF